MSFPENWEVLASAGEDGVSFVFKAATETTRVYANRFKAKFDANESKQSNATCESQRLSDMTAGRVYVEGSDTVLADCYQNIILDIEATEEAIADEDADIAAANATPNGGILTFAQYHITAEIGEP